MPLRYWESQIQETEGSTWLSGAGGGEMGVVPWAPSRSFARWESSRDLLLHSNLNALTTTELHAQTSKMGWGLCCAFFITIKQFLKSISGSKYFLNNSSPSSVSRSSTVALLSSSLSPSLFKGLYHIGMTLVNPPHCPHEVICIIFHRNLKLNRVKQFAQHQSPAELTLESRSVLIQDLVHSTNHSSYSTTFPPSAPPPPTQDLACRGGEGGWERQAGNIWLFLFLRDFHLHLTLPIHGRFQVN